jgi:hypothetical protein
LMLEVDRNPHALGLTFVHLISYQFSVIAPCFTLPFDQ